MPKANHIPALDAGKEEGHTADNRAAQTNHKGDSISKDPLVGWFSLAAGVTKPSRERTPKRSWIRGAK